MSSEIDPVLAAYEYVDDYGHTLTARPSFDLLDTACVRTSQAVFVKAEDLPGLVAKLYEAAGRPCQQSVMDRRDLLIEPSVRVENAVYFGQTAARGWHIRAKELPELVGALYVAAGRSAPIILDRPAEKDLREGGWLDRNQVNTDAYRVVGSIAPSVARELAACLAGAADVADAEPDPEQVEDIVELIYQSGVIDGSEWGAAQAAKIARAILAAGYARTEEQA